MSPRTTLTSCGSSSIESFRRTRPTRRDPGVVGELEQRAVRLVPVQQERARCASASTTIVRSLRIVNGTPSCPTRRWRNSAGPGESAPHQRPSPGAARATRARGASRPATVTSSARLAADPPPLARAPARRRASGCRPPGWGTSRVRPHVLELGAQLHVEPGGEAGPHQRGRALVGQATGEHEAGGPAGLGLDDRRRHRAHDRQAVDLGAWRQLVVHEPRRPGGGTRAPPRTSGRPPAPADPLPRRGPAARPTARRWSRRSQLRTAIRSTDDGAGGGDTCRCEPPPGHRHARGRRRPPRGRQREGAGAEHRRQLVHRRARAPEPGGRAPSPPASQATGDTTVSTADLGRVRHGAVGDRRPEQRHRKGRAATTTRSPRPTSRRRAWWPGVRVARATTPRPSVGGLATTPCCAAPAPPAAGGLP